MRWVKRVFWGLVLLLVVVFATINMREGVEVTIDPFGLGYEALRPIFAPLPVIIFATLAIGLVIGVFLENDRARSSRRELRSKQDEVTVLRTELSRLRTMMKAEDHPESVRLPAARR